VPSTRLKSSDSGEYLAVGGSDGSVTVFRTENNKLERISTEVCHDLPVTGLSFAPQGSAYALVGAPELVVSCSADNKVAAIKLGGMTQNIYNFASLLFDCV
jgi:WD40 repeat protein